MNTLVLLLALISQADSSPWDTATRVHVIGSLPLINGNYQPGDAWSGSGTIIKSSDAESIILTCQHIFTTITQNPTVRVDLFDGKPTGWPQEMTATESHVATTIDKDAALDLALIKISPGRRLKYSRLMLDGSKLREGQRVRVAGCAGGRNTSIFDAEITRPFIHGIQDKPTYLAIECRVAPSTGRSGGGLFNAGDELIGVTGYQQAATDRGFYAHPHAIKAFLEKNKVDAK